jgi:hypothetical protein
MKVSARIIFPLCTGLAALVAAPVAHAGGSVSISPPRDGAVYYTGSAQTASVTYTASFDRGDCEAGLWYVEKKNADSATWGGSVMGGGLGNHQPSGSKSETQDVLPGTYNLRGYVNCVKPQGESLSATRTFKVVKGSEAPARDRDNDGTEDTRDKCLDIPGPPKNTGCPADPSNPNNPDGDTVRGTDDKCPNSAGPTWNAGCRPGTPAAIKRSAETKARAARSSQCSRAKLSAEARRTPPPFAGTPAVQVVALRRCYARGIPGIPEGWPIVTFWVNASFSPLFEVYPPDLRPANSPPVTRVSLKARRGFNAYAVKSEQVNPQYGLAVFSFLTAQQTPTNTGTRLQVGWIFPSRGAMGRYRRINP